MSFRDAMNQWSLTVVPAVLVQRSGTAHRWSSVPLCLGVEFFFHNHECQVGDWETAVSQTPQGTDSIGEYEPRLVSLSSLVRAMGGLGISDSPLPEVRECSIGIADIDGALNALPAWEDSEVRVFLIAEYGTNKEQHVPFTGRVRGVSWDAGVLTLECHGVLGYVFQTAPEWVVRVDGQRFPYVETQELGKLAPIVYGRLREDGGAHEIINTSGLHSIRTERNRDWLVAGHRCVVEELYYRDQTSGGELRRIPASEWFTTYREERIIRGLSGNDSYGYTILQFSSYDPTVDRYRLPNDEFLDEYTGGLFVNITGKPLLNDVAEPAITNPYDALVDFCATYLDTEGLGTSFQYPFWQAGYPLPMFPVHDYCEELQLKIAGVVTEMDSPLDVIESMCKSFGFRLHDSTPFNYTGNPPTPSAGGQLDLTVGWVPIGRYMDSPPSPYPAFEVYRWRWEDITLTVDDVQDIAEGGFSVDRDADNYANVITARYRRPLSGRNRGESLELRHEDIVNPSPSVDARGEVPYTLELDWVRDYQTAYNVTALLLWRYSIARQLVTVEGAMNLCPGEVSFNRRLWHGQWASDQRGQIVRVEVDPLARRATVTYAHVDGLYGEAQLPYDPWIVLGDEDVIDPLWTFTTAAEREFGYLCNESTYKFSNNATGKQLGPLEGLP